MNEYFLDSGCTVPFQLLTYLILFFFLNVGLTLIVKDRQLGIIVLIYSFSQFLLFHQLHLIVRSFVYLFYIPNKLWVRLFIGFFLLFQSILGFVYRDGLVFSMLFYLLVVLLLITYKFKTEELEDGTIVESETSGLFKRNPPELLIVVFDFILMFIYLMVYCFGKPYGTYICFIAGSFLPFVTFFYHCIIKGDDKDNARIKMAIYLFSYFLIDTPFTFLIRYCVYIVDLYEQRNVVVYLFLASVVIILSVLCGLNEYTGIVISYALGLFPLLFLIKDSGKIGIAFDFFAFVFFCIPLYFNKITMLWLFFLASLPGLFFSFYVPAPPPPQPLSEVDVENLEKKDRLYNRERLQLIVANSVENCYIGFVFVLAFGFAIFICFYVLLLGFSGLELAVANATPF